LIKQKHATMKYTGNTVTKPVVGRAAEKLSHALRTGGSVTNDAAKETIRQIIEYRKKLAQTDAASKSKI
jgi:hypothetical protein